jgi:signal transduction histidine kinase
VDLNDAWQDARQQIEAEILSKNATIESAPLLGCVQAHHTTLVQVLVNLLSNGMKFVGKGVRPEIRVRSESKDGIVRLTVDDNGIGIAAEHQQQIFLAFERLHGVEEYPGTGIGLAFVSKAVERMGGHCGVTSTTGQGSSFWIELQKG